MTKIVNTIKTVTITDEFIEWMKKNGITCAIDTDPAFDDELHVYLPFDYYITIFDVLDAKESSIEDTDSVEEFYSRVIEELEHDIDDTLVEDFYDNVIIANNNLEQLIIAPLKAHMMVLTGKTKTEDVEGESKLRELAVKLNGLNDQLREINATM